MAEANWWDSDPVATPAPEQGAPGGNEWWASDPQVPAASAEKPPPGREVSYLESAARGAGQGVSFGLADEVQGAAAAGGGYLPHQLLGGLGQMAIEKLASQYVGRRATDAYDRAVTAERAANREAREANPMTYLGGELGGGLAGGAGIVRAGGSLAANAVARGAPLRGVAGASAIDGGILGAVQGAASGETPEQRGIGAGIGSIAGGIVGAAAPYVTSGISSAVRRAVTPVTVDAERRAAGDILRREGVDLSAGQMSGSNPLRYRESELGGSAVQALMERQGEQFTAAALRRVGSNASRATPDAMQSAYDRIGQQFRDIGGRNAVSADRQLADDLISSVQDYASMTAPSLRAPIVESLARDVAAAFKNGTMTGDVYNRYASAIADRARKAGGDTNLRGALYGLREALDDAMERSMQRAGSADMPALREARSQYRNWLTLERATSGAGENAALGIISPSALRGATVGTQGRRNYALGNGDFAELARAGESLMRPLPNSGTAARLKAQGITSLLGAGAGGTYGAQQGEGGGWAGAAMGAAAPWAVGQVLMSRLGQRYLTNQVMPGSVSPEVRQFLDSALRHTTIPITQRAISAP